MESLHKLGNEQVLALGRRDDELWQSRISKRSHSSESSTFCRTRRYDHRTRSRYVLLQRRTGKLSRNVSCDSSDVCFDGDEAAPSGAVGTIPGGVDVAAREKG